MDCSWEHRRRSSAPRLLIRPALDEGVFGSCRSNFLSRESLTASQKIGEREIEGKSGRGANNRGRRQVGGRELLLHLETTCTRFNTTKRRTCSSAGPGRSQQLQILPSLNSKAPTIPDATKIWHTPKIWHPPKSWHPPSFHQAPSFYHGPSFYHWAKFLPCAKFLPGANVFVYFSAFLFSMRK